MRALSPVAVAGPSVDQSSAPAAAAHMYMSIQRANVEIKIMRPHDLLSRHGQAKISCVIIYLCIQLNKNVIIQVYNQGAR